MNKTKKPVPPPKIEEAQQSTPSVVEQTTLADKISALPSWLQYELQNVAPVGARNNHCIKIAPALMREGLTPSETLEALAELYPNARPGEIEGLVRRATVYAEQESTADPNWGAKHAKLADLCRFAEEELPKILQNYELAEIDTPDWDLDTQRRKFLERMFDLEDVIWIGDVKQSGPRFRHHFKSVRTWLNSRTQIPGEFTAHSTFKPGTVNRSYENILKRKYLVLESDILEAEELASVAAYLRDHHKMIMRAIVTTGGVRHAPKPGLHFWFHYPGDHSMDEWEAVLRGYGADVSTLRGPQPVRLPGCVRASTGLKQEVWWLA